MKNFTLSLSLTFFVLGCISSSEILQADIPTLNDSHDEKICRSEKVMGSKGPQTTCYTTDELEGLEEICKKIPLKRNNVQDIN